MTVEPRLYLNTDLSAGAELALGKEESHYLLTVMRRKAGDGVRVFNGRDGEWRAEVADAGKRAARLSVQARLREQRESPDVHLYFSPVKRARTDFIVEKATELGAARIAPVMTRRTMAETVRLDRLAAHAREAAEQTERLDLPQIGEPRTLAALIDGWAKDRALLFCDEAGDEGGKPWGGEAGRAKPILEALQRFERGTPFAILIGPEGGFDPAERDILRDQDFVVPVTLGPRILRADTAAAAALTVYQAVLGDWNTSL
ncbi:16S rRNA (uracil(1498)-N(3))-methyltransferase [Marinicauda sp. Alg238-R41]|uniref:16S rRNA (uracil(1498)-N(3))-methyltransferase n=1 Tax=Marinicauda sp. Alg238-R41 TaxID=2993447 RepID=UPI0022E80B00|nr:16S rRNA (uracil(1498)-N(3))-methyltransferase [Marinicauda sp. Alg238-R41]